MKKKRKELRRAAAMLLAALLTVNSVDLTAFTVYAAQSESVPEIAEGKAVFTITDFDDLEETVINQQLSIGAGEDEIIFPDTLDVTVSVSASDEDSETKIEETEESEVSATESKEADESETFQSEIVETTEETESDNEASEVESVTGENESAENTETENSQEQKEEIKDTENVENTESTDTASVFDTLHSAFAPMTVYAAENKDDTVSENNTETTEIIETKKITLTDITWELNLAESDKDTFDSSEECDGYCYVYTPVFLEKDEDGNALFLGEDVETPVIYVLIGSGEAYVNPIAENGYDEEGFCEAYEWVDGVLTQKADTTCSHDNCNGYQPAVETTEKYDIDADGNTDTVYEISNAGQLYWFAAKVNASTDENPTNNINGKLMNNITVNENVLKEDGTLNGDDSDFRVWIPIGAYIEDKNEDVLVNSIYSGTFDGNNCTISGLYFNDIKNDAIGLVGYGEDASIQNVGVKDFYFNCRGCAGGIVGAVYSAGINISNCYSVGTILGKVIGYVGGIIGDINSGNEITISDCYHRGVVNGGDYDSVGGIIGYLYVKNETIISNCYHNGSISGSKYVGGVIGGAYIDSNMMVVSNCYNMGTVDGRNYVGGVVGWGNLAKETNLSISDCYNIGAVSGSKHVGGIIGYITSAKGCAKLLNCYNTGKVNGGSGYVGGVIGYSPILGSRNKILNCYYPIGCATDDSGTPQFGIGNSTMGSTTPDVEGYTIGKTEEQFQSGEVTYLLNGERSVGTDTNPLVWYQTCGEGLPSFSGKTVYYGYLTCDEDKAPYNNERTGSETRPDHSITYSVNGAAVNADCTVCQKNEKIELVVPSDLRYDGTEKKLSLNGEITGIDTPDIQYYDNENKKMDGFPVNVGDYTARFSIVAGGQTYTASADFSIDWLKTDETAVLTNQNGDALSGTSWWAQSVTFTAPDGFSISRKFDGTYAESFTFDNDDKNTDSNGGMVTYYLKNSDGEVAQKSETVYIDRTAPTFPSEGGISFNNTNTWWKELLNTISFGTFFNETVKVEVKAEDTGSGIAAYYYWVDTSGSTNALTGAELSNKTFKEASASEIDTISEDNHYVYYVYVMDKAGNRSEIICSDGVVVDKTAPVIESVTKDLSDTTADIMVTATDNGSGVDTYYLVYSTDSLDDVTAENIKNNEKDNLPEGAVLSSNQNGSFKLKELSPVTTYYYAVTVSDRAGNLSAVETGNFTTAKTKPVFAASDIPKITGTYGETLSQMQLSATKVTSSNGISGTWSVTQVNADDIYPTVNDTTEYEITFIPDDTAHFDTYVAEVRPQVAKKVLTVGSVEADGRKYDGTDKVKITGVILDGIREIDNVSVNVTEIYGTVNGSDVGTYTKVTALPTLSLTGADAGNYELVQPDGQVTLTESVEITKASYGNQQVEKNYCYAVEYSGEEMNLTEYLPGDCGTVQYGEPSVIGDVEITNCSINDGKLSYTVKKFENFTKEKEGTISISVTTQNYQSFTITIKVTQIEKRTVILNDTVTLKNSVLTYGKALSTLVFNSAEFVDDDGNAIEGILAWENPDLIPTAGTTSAKWVFTPDNAEYATLSGTVSIMVNKATPKVTTGTPTVTEFTYNPNTTLTDVTLDATDVTVTGANGEKLNGTWSWVTADIVPAVNNSGYKAVFTPTDTANYETVTRTITVKVNKATPDVRIQPTASEITYGYTLGDSALTGGVAYSSAKDNAITIGGVFTWENISIKPTVADSKENNATQYIVVFTPTDKADYETVKTTITLTVQKSVNTPDMPGSTLNVPYSCKKVSDYTLAGDWTWNTQDAGKELEVGTQLEVEAVYNGADKGNYVTESVKITITRSACEHKNTELINVKEATCQDSGYTGDTWCKDCEKTIAYGSSTPLKDHKGGTATCTKKAVCTACHQEYGTTNPDNHVHTELRNYQTATCTSSGYTGDTYCADCGTKLKSGTTIDALGYNYKSEVTKEPTTTSTGVRTYTCKNCGHSYTETIAKLPEEHSHSYTGAVTKEADCTNAGIKTYTCSCGDSYTESIPALGHHYISKVTKEATVAEEGIMTYTCDRCGHSYTRPIAKLESNEPDNNKPDNNKPGDTNNPDDNSKPDTSRPETGKPYIEGREDQNGWDNIKDQLEAAKEKDTLTVEMNGTTVVPGDIFDTIKGKDVSVVFDMGDGIYWKVNGKDITEDKVGDIDFGVTVGTQAGNTIPVEIINKVTGERFYMNLTLAYDGEFGFKATLTLNVDKKNAGMYANLFYYNPETGALEYICADQIDEDGNAELTFTHASDYTIVIDEGEMKEAADTGVGEDNPSVPETSDNGLKAWKMAWILLIGSMVMVIGIGTFYITKRKKEE